MMKHTVLVSFLLIAYAFTVKSQSIQDTSFVRAAIYNTFQVYQQEIGPQSKLYNGSKYVAPEHTLEQHPYFLSPDWIMGSLAYDGESFTQVPLMFDLYSSEVIAEHKSSGHPIRLIFEKLTFFSIGGHRFEKIDNTSVGGSLPSTGFYDVLHGGKTKVVVKRQKMLRERVSTQSIERFFDERSRYFLFKNGVYFSVKSKASVFRLLADEKKRLKIFLKKNQINFPENKEIALQRMVAHYDSLKLDAKL